MLATFLCLHTQSRFYACLHEHISLFPTSRIQLDHTHLTITSGEIARCAGHGRTKALANTQFMKGGTRLVVSLVGVLVPAVIPRPVFYTVLEDKTHGADMTTSIMVDVLRESVRVMGNLPRRLFVQADNTPKETKNTIVLFAAAWLLAQLQHTRLQSIEFGYLVVGHTHDLIDAIFAHTSNALHGEDVLSIPEMFTVLGKKMSRPPFWKHLRDVFAFKDSSKYEHVRITTTR